MHHATDTAKRLLRTKVPEITVVFWILKLLTTGMGEAMSDAMGQKSVPIAAAVGIFGMWFAIWLQLRQREYKAPYYWFAVMMVAVFGTMAADGIHDGAGIRYAVTTPAFALITGLIFWRWYRTRGHALDPQHRHQASREVLLGHGARHVRARHGGGRPHGVPAQPGLLAIGAPVCGRVRGPGCRLVAVQLEPDLLVLVRVRRHATARSFVRRLASASRPTVGSTSATRQSA